MSERSEQSADAASDRPGVDNFVRALGVVKKAAAQANNDLGLVDDEKADAIVEALRGLRPPPPALIAAVRRVLEEDL